MKLTCKSCGQGAHNEPVPTPQSRVFVKCQKFEPDWEELERALDDLEEGIAELQPYSKQTMRPFSNRPGE